MTSLHDSLVVDAVFCISDNEPSEMFEFEDTQPYIPDKIITVKNIHINFLICLIPSQTKNVVNNTDY